MVANRQSSNLRARGPRGQGRAESRATRPAGSNTSTAHTAALDTRPFPSGTRLPRPLRSSGCPDPGGCVPDERTHDHKTHKTEERVICYPWHPLYQKAVWVIAQRCTSPHAVYKCRLAEREDRYGWELPVWMFDQAECATMRLTEAPHVSWHALRELQRVLAETMGNVVVQHRQLLAPGGTDETTTTAAARSAAEPVRSASGDPSLGSVASRDPASCSAAPRASTARTSASCRRARGAGGGR